VPETSAPPQPLTLYGALGEQAPPGAARGETRRTAQKETIDDDREALDTMTVLDGH
jgi:hypothetical protein